MTLEERVSALPLADQSTFFGFLEYIEWKRRLPGADAGRNKARSRKDVGARLLAVRETLKQSEESAADAAGLTLKTYQQYERGRIGRWATAKMLNYVDVWNISLDWLSLGNGTMFRGAPPQLEPSLQPSVAPQAVEAQRSRRVAQAPASNVIDWKAARARKGGPA
jgi:transcriptional regulator with XRE-family HTH domain